MADYRSTDGARVTVERRGPGRTIAIILGVLALIAVLLFATGFWSADVKEGSLPQVDVSAKGGAPEGRCACEPEVCLWSRSGVV